MKKLLILPFVLFLIFFAADNSNAVIAKDFLPQRLIPKELPGEYLNKKELQTKEAEKEYLDIFSNYFLFTKENTPEKYADFLKKCSDCHLADEAKLRIAEFYDIIDQTEKAKEWLDDIIQNHPNDNYSAIRVLYNKTGTERRGIELRSTEEKTAAWALYYRVAWFKHRNVMDRVADLGKILSQYKNNRKVVVYANWLLRKLKKSLIQTPQKGE